MRRNVGPLVDRSVGWLVRPLHLFLIAYFAVLRLAKTAPAQQHAAHLAAYTALLDSLSDYHFTEYHDFHKIKEPSYCNVLSYDALTPKLWFFGSDDRLFS